MPIARPEDSLQESVKGKLCARCSTQPWVAWLQTGETTENAGLPKYAFRLRCNCYPRDYVLIDAPKDRVKERYGEVAMTQLAPQLREGMNLQPREIREFLAPKASDQEVTLFLKVCLDSEWNPFVGDAFLIPFWDANTKGFKHAIVVGLQGYLKRAVRNPAWQGYRSGIVVKNGGQVVEREGSIAWEGDKLLGGWAEVHRKGEIPLPHKVALAPYDKIDQPNQRLWKTMPAQMIEKVAISQGVRRKFPELDRAYPGIEIRVDEGIGEEGYQPSTAPALVEGSMPQEEPLLPDAQEGPQETTEGGAAPQEAQVQATAAPKSLNELWARTAKAGVSTMQVHALFRVPEPKAEGGNVGSLPRWLEIKGNTLERAWEIVVQQLKLKEA